MDLIRWTCPFASHIWFQDRMRRHIQKIHSEARRSLYNSYKHLQCSFSGDPDIILVELELRLQMSKYSVETDEEPDLEWWRRAGEWLGCSRTTSPSLRIRLNHIVRRINTFKFQMLCMRISRKNYRVSDDIGVIFDCCSIDFPSSTTRAIQKPVPKSSSSSGGRCRNLHEFPLKHLRKTKSLCDIYSETSAKKTILYV